MVAGVYFMNRSVSHLFIESKEKPIVAYWSNDSEGQTHRSEAILRAMFESSQDGIVIINPEGRVITFNFAANELIWRLSGKELYGGSRFTSHLEQDQIPGFLNIFGRVLCGEIIHLEKRISLPDESTIWVHYTYNPVISERGAVMGVCLTVRDITVRKETDNILGKNKRLIKALIEGVADYAFYLLDSEGYITSWNSGAQRLLGYEENEIIGREIVCFYPHGDLEHSIPQLALVMARKNSCYETEGWRIRKDGSSFWAQSVLCALNDSDGRLYGYVDIIRDISEKKKQDEKYIHTRPSSLDEF
jgi:PAS domain S-box-containing protein